MELKDIYEKFNSRDKFDKIKRRIRNNDILSEYYDYLAVLYEKSERDVALLRKVKRIPLSLDSEKFRNKAQNMRLCSKFWTIDYYRLQAVKDLKRVNLCHDKFCDACQNALAIQRDQKYAPVLDALFDKYNMYHVVFTVPNCTADLLQDTLDKMYMNIGYLVRILKGDAKIKGLSFEPYGFVGAIRSLEITRNSDTSEFHPHFHCIFLFNRGSKRLWRGKHILNSFSFDNRDSDYKKQRYFSEFEILLQKIWYLRINGVKVTLGAINTLREGYSCIVEPCTKQKYKEVFKYATKGLMKSEKDDPFGNFYDWLFLMYALHGRRIIQTYGVLRCLKFEEKISLDAKVDEEYFAIIRKLHEIEIPEQFFEVLETLERECSSGKITFISRSKVAEVLGKNYES